MVNLKQYSFVGLGLIAMIAVGADEIDISLSSEAARLGYLTDSSLIGLPGGDLGIGVLFNEDSDVMSHLGLTVRGQPAGEAPVNFGLGGRLYLGRLDEADASVAGLALGGRVSYTVPANIPLHLVGEAFYAPKITSLGEAESFLDLTTRFEVEFTPRAAGFVGYRLLEIGTEDDDDVEADDSVHLGVRLTF